MSDMKIEINCQSDAFLKPLFKKDNPVKGDQVELEDGTLVTLSEKTIELGGVEQFIFQIAVGYAAGRAVDVALPRVYQFLKKSGVYHELKRMGARVFFRGTRVDLDKTDPDEVTTANDADEPQP